MTRAADQTALALAESLRIADAMARTGGALATDFDWAPIANMQALRGAAVTELWFGLWLAPSERQAAWGPRVFDLVAPPGWTPNPAPEGSVLAAGPGGRRVVFAEDGGSFTPERRGVYEVRLRPSIGVEMGRRAAKAFLAAKWAREDRERFLGLGARGEPGEPHAVAGRPRAKTEEDEDPTGRASSSRRSPSGSSRDLESSTTESDPVDPREADPSPEKA